MTDFRDTITDNLKQVLVKNLGKIKLSIKNLEYDATRTLSDTNSSVEDIKAVANLFGSY